MIRLTSYARGGGCACKLPPGELEALLAPLSIPATPDLLVGLASGDDAAVIQLDEDRALVCTTDFFTPVVDDAFEWGRIAATNALSDIYAMGGTPLVALNLVSWPRAELPMDLLAEVLRGAARVCREAGCHLVGGHSIDAAEPTFGLAVTGWAHPNRLLRNDAGRPGDPLTLTKPLGIGALTNRHQRTGETFPQAINAMTQLNRDASLAALAAGARAATDVTGFGLLGHAAKLARASGVSAHLDFDAIPVLAGAREAIAAGYVPGGARRNLDWVAADLAHTRGAEDLLLLADPQTSGGLLICGEIPGSPVIGHLREPGDALITIR